MYIERRKDSETLPLITDWYSLGAAIGVKAQTLAWALKNRPEMQSKIRLGERTVYKSAPVLRFVQQRLNSLLVPIFDGLEDTSSAIAYRKGLVASDVVRETGHAKTLISFDVRHYFDSIGFEHLVNVLCQAGMAELGARLVARYGLVKRRGRESLQQGSPASPVLSNLVGHYLMDKPIKAWLALEYPGVNCTYLRYCDNVALFVHDEAPDDFAERYKSFVKELFAANGFKTHKWATVSDTHPVMHQKFLGMVLNAEARAELDIVDRLRAILFNCCRSGLYQGAKEFFTASGALVEKSFVSATAQKKFFMQHITGHLNYIARLNWRQGNMLHKLQKAAIYLDEKYSDSARETPLPPSVFAAVKRYRCHTETIDQYMDAVKKSCIA